MEVPVCLEKRRVGTMRVEPSGADTVFRVCCTGLPAGLYRLYACGAGGELLLGVTEDGCLHRVFSPALLAPAGDIRCAVLRRCGGDASRPGLLARLPPEAHTVRRGGCAEVTIPWREGEPFPIPELFCFASVGQGRVTYLFDGEGRPSMPK